MVISSSASLAVAAGESADCTPRALSFVIAPAATSYAVSA